MPDLIRDLHNSNSGASDPEYWELVQVDLMGRASAQALERWVLLGIWAGELFKGGDRPRWSVQLSRSEYRRLKASASWSARAEGYPQGHP